MNDQRWLGGSPDPVEAELRRALDGAADRTGDDVALRRVWSKLPQTAPSPLLEPPRDWARGLARSMSRWRWFVGGAASGVVAAAVLAVVFWPRHAPSPVVASGASVPVVRPLSVDVAAPARPHTWPMAGPRRAIVGPTIEHAAANESLALWLPGGVAVTVGPGAVLSLDARQRPSVDVGEVSFSVPHQPPGETFVVTAGSYQVVVIGTRFRVRNGDRVSVDVDEGVVEVRRGGERLARLAVGESWSGGALVAADAPRTEGAPVGARRAVHHRGKGHRRARAARLAALTMTAKAAMTGKGLASASASGHATPAPSADAVVDGDLGAADAEKALAAGDVRRGLELYGEILSRGGPAAENAAYEIGKVLRDRLHQPEAAVAAWRRYRGAHPDGLLRAETDVSIVETLVQLGDRGGALAEAMDFLRRDPISERRAEIARLAGDLQRASGDCRAALASYALVPARARRGELIEQVAAGRDACQQRLTPAVTATDRRGNSSE